MSPPVDPARYAAYLGVMAVMVATPGPANLFAIATGAAGGRAAVIRAVAGMNAASLVWIGGAALGLAALARAQPRLFHAMAYVGAAYLAWLAFLALRAALRGEAEAPHASGRAGRFPFRDGFAVQMSNPKALVFTTVVLPPFIDPSRGVAGQLGVLAGTMIAMDLVTMTAYGFGGAALARRMTEPRFRRGFAAFTGLLLLAAATLIALRA